MLGDFQIIMPLLHAYASPIKVLIAQLVQLLEYNTAIGIADMKDIFITT
jgi:hypothetical protein